MALKGVKPSAIEARLKVLFYGVANSGKTTAAIQFPKPYIIDTEGSTNKPKYVKEIEKTGGAVLYTVDFDEMLAEVKTLLTTKHEYKTLVIDSLTILYNDLLDKAEKKVGADFGRHYGESNKRMKHLLNLLFRLDMNVIITCHSKNEYGQNLAVLGQTFDGYKKLDYLFDLVFEVQKRGKDRFAVVKKTRLENFADDEVFPFSYAKIAEKYGKDILEKDSVPQQLATQEQLNELARLIELLNVREDVVDKWLSKADSASLEEMQVDQIQKCIDFLKKQIQG